jgi:PhnB protein
MGASPIPPGFRTVTPHLTVKGCAAALEFYKQAFGAEEHFRMPGPGGMLMHSEFKIGDSILMAADEFDMPGMPIKSPTTAGCATSTVALYVTDCDAWFARATKAGAKVVMPPTDMFWGDRYGTVVDPFGVVWSIATHKEDVGPEEMQKRMAQMCGPGGP